MMWFVRAVGALKHTESIKKNPQITPTHLFLKTSCGFLVYFHTFSFPDGNDLNEHLFIDNLVDDSNFFLVSV